MHFQFASFICEVSKPNLTLSRAKQLHALVTRTHLLEDPFYGTKFVRFYEINEKLVYARNVFEKSPKRSVYLWNSIIRAYARARDFGNAFFLFNSMLRTETKPDRFTFACLLRACSESDDLDKLRVVHGGLVVSGFGVDSICGSALVNAYSKLGTIGEASRVFNGMTNLDLVLCNSMISAFGHCGLWDKGLNLLGDMHKRGIKPDGYSLVGLMSGLADFSLLGIGQGMHGYCLKSGFDFDVHTSSALVSMYSKCSCLKSAQKLFSSLFEPDLVTWSALITGYAQCGDYGKALFFFKQMTRKGGRADLALTASVLAASAQLADIAIGSELHSNVIRHGYEMDVVVVSALIDMYLKCGFVEFGIRVFRNMPNPSTVSYNLVISGLGLHGLAFIAFEMFDEMLQKGFIPDGCTFSALLCTCCHAGLRNDALEFFRRMQNEFGIQAKTEHYLHLVKLLGMDGKLEEAYNLILTLPEPIESSIWGAFLSCCDFHGYSNMAESVAQRLFESEPDKPTYRVMLSNVYAGDGRWDDLKKLRDGMEKERIKKMPGISSWR